MNEAATVNLLVLIVKFFGRLISLGAWALSVLFFACAFVTTVYPNKCDAVHLASCQHELVVLGWTALAVGVVLGAVGALIWRVSK